MTAAVDAPALDVSALRPLNSKREVADFLGRGVDFVNALMRRGELAYYKSSSTRQATVRIGRSHVADYLRRCER